MELDSRHTSRHTRLWMKSQILMFHWDSRLFWFYQINSSRVSAGGNSSFSMKPGNTNPIPGLLSGNQESRKYHTPYQGHFSGAALMLRSPAPSILVLLPLSLNMALTRTENLIHHQGFYRQYITRHIKQSGPSPFLQSFLYKQETMKCQPCLFPITAFSA